MKVEQLDQADELVDDCSHELSFHAVTGKKSLQPLSSSEISEIELVEGILHGSKQCEELLYHRYSKGLVLMLTNRSGDFSLAEDLAQDKLLVVLSRLRSNGIDKPENLTAFVYQTAKFILIGFQRRLRNKMELSFDDPVEGVDSASPETRLLRQSTGEETRRLISELKVERDRELLMRFYVYEHPKQQVCQDLDLSTDHFDRVIHRAKRRFRELVTGKGIH